MTFRPPNIERESVDYHIPDAALIMVSLTQPCPITEIDYSALDDLCSWQCLVSYLGDVF